MVKTTVHTCKDCDKNYKSYQSLCNHRTKKHKMCNIDQSKHEVNISQQSVNVDNKSSLSNIETVNTFNCRKCNKIYKYKQSRWFHEKSCNGILLKKENTEIIENKNTEIIENKNTQIIETQNIQNNNTQNNNTNNGTINNTTIILNNFNEENISYLKDVHNKAVDLLQKWVDTHRLEITRAMMNSLKDYKLVNPKYIKKMIHDEINLLGYLYYKNHMENEVIKERDEEMRKDFESDNKH